MTNPHRSPRASSRSPILALVLLVTLAASGGTEPDSGVASIEDASQAPSVAPNDDVVDTEEAVLAFTECLRDQGLDIDDPTFDADGAFQLDLRRTFGGPGQEQGPSDELESAMEACGDLMDGVRQRFTDIDLTEIEDSLLAFSECMRNEGFDVPDPDFSAIVDENPGPGRGRSLLGDLDPTDPGVAEAIENCQTEFGPGIRVPGGRNEG